MKRYKVIIEETLRRTVEVDAENPELAICQVENAYNAHEYVLSPDDFIGADIALSMCDKEAKSALSNLEFISFVEQKYLTMNCQIGIEDKIVAAFGSMDNALSEFKERGEKSHTTI